EMAALHSARYCREYLRGLILQKGRKSSGKIHPAAVPHGLTGDYLNAVTQEAEFQRVFSLRVEEVLAHAPVVLQMVVRRGEVRPQRGEVRVAGAVGSNDDQTDGIPIGERDIRANDLLPGLRRIDNGIGCRVCPAEGNPRRIQKCGRKDVILGKRDELAAARRGVLKLLETVHAGAET